MTKSASNRRICVYAQNAREEYDNQRINAQRLIEEVWNQIQRQAIISDNRRKDGGEPPGQHVVENATRNLLSLTSKYTKGAWVKWQCKYKQNKSDGLWPWLNTGADVIEEGPSPHTYRIRPIFYDILYKVVIGCLPLSAQISKPSNCS